MPVLRRGDELEERALVAIEHGEAIGHEVGLVIREPLARWREQRLPFPRLRNRQAEAVEDRRRDIHLRGEGQIRIRRSRRVVEQHRDADVFVVQVPAVRPVPLAKALAVIAGHDHDRIVQIALGAQRLEDLADDAVGLAAPCRRSGRACSAAPDLVRLEARADAIVRAA